MCVIVCLCESNNRENSDILYRSSAYFPFFLQLARGRYISLGLGGSKFIGGEGERNFLFSVDDQGTPWGPIRLPYDRLRVSLGQSDRGMALTTHTHTHVAPRLKKE